MAPVSTFSDRLDEEHRRALESLPEGLTDFSDVVGARARIDALMQAAAGLQAAVEGVTIENDIVPGEGGRPDLAIRFYRPDGIAAPTPAMLFIHGGGYVVGAVSHFDTQAAQLAQGAGIVVASIEYRLAPEHPYPIPLEDCYAALGWLHRGADGHGLDASRIGVGGTSAGSGLAAGLSLLARDRGEHAVAFQFLEAPMLDHRSMTPSCLAIEDRRVWNVESNRQGWAAYLGQGHLAREVPVYASPARARDLSGLPPAYVSVGGQDCFADEAAEFARRLHEAGVSVEFHLYELGFHGSPRILPNSAVSKRWRRDAHEAVARLAHSDLASSQPKSRSE
jgi:acetyl esterase/lipase